MFTLFKWLLWCCMPYSLVLICLLLAGLIYMLKRRFRFGFSLLLLSAFLSVLSLPAITTMLGYSLEKKCPPTALNDIPKADAIVVLGGGIGSTESGLPYPECYPASDRVVMAARLYHAGKAPLIVPTGSATTTAEMPLLQTMRIPSSVILCEEEARDTAENASKTIELLRKRGCKRVLLVTSAWHMPRATMLFQDKEIEFIPVGCDYEATLARLEAEASPLWMKLPTPSALAQTSVYLKEYLGILFYSFRNADPES